LGLISLAGGLFILIMGYQGICTKGLEVHLQGEKPRSLAKGILANLLNPHPYLFWFSVGAPTITKAMSQGTFAPVAFMGSFYLFLVGSKIALALLADKSKAFLSGKVYIYIMRFLGVVLWFLAISLFREGLHLLNIL
jgi:threonine/homoserine/homoserine lactone efflux protein